MSSIRVLLRKMMNGEASYPLLLLLLQLLLLVTCKADSLNYTRCSNHTIPDFPIFEANLNKLLQSLPSNTSSSENYCYTSVGEDPSSRVYGQALCRGDVNATVCSSCVQNIARVILKQCAKDEDVIVFYELCQVRYSTKDFNSTLSYAGKHPAWNNSRQNIAKPEVFSNALKNLLTQLSGEASYNGKMFALGESSIDKDHKLYGLVQCTRDLSRENCINCLDHGKGDITGYFDESNASGGILVDRKCTLRYELYPFYQPSPDRKKPVHGKNRNAALIAVGTCASIILMGIVTACCVCYVKSHRSQAQKDGEKSELSFLHDSITKKNLNSSIRGGDQDNNQEQLNLMDLSTIKLATDEFSASNKLGQGGFGIVYKGVLEDGKEVAIKRLSKKSWQGLDEFKNEVILIARLQHRNLVRLLGCCLEDEEKLLIYEFMPNRSLDVFIFNPARRQQIDWTTSFNIITGIVRGLVYLHEDSRLKIIHRDLKPNNILLDDEMNAKISDFGMARIFGENQDQANTRRVVGTHGYMAPEYAMEGLFSVKSDVYSFGVVLLEIISGKRCSGFYMTEHAQSLLSYAWELWTTGRGMEFVDPLLNDSCSEAEVLKCIHIGLLCVQQDQADRPTMSSVLSSLGTESVQLPQPAPPAFSVGRRPHNATHSSGSAPGSINEITLSVVSAR